MFKRILAVLTALFLPSVQAADVRICEKLAFAIAYQYQRGALGLERRDLFDYLRRKFNETEWSAHWGNVKPDEFWDTLHDDVLEYLTHAPTERNLSTLAGRFGFTEEQALDVLTYFASRHYFNHVETLGQPREVLARLSRVSREHRLTDENSELARLYPFYLLNLTHLSVPEMARLLHKPEDDVYDDLSKLKLSIEAEFSHRLSLAEVQNRVAAGESLHDIALDYGVGEQALNFYLHYENELNRGIEWKREVSFEDAKRSEESILRILWRRKWDSQLIANELNRLFNVKEATDPNLRTDASVSAKARLLGLSKVIERGGELEPHPIYGVLKRHGELVPENVIPYLYDNYRSSIAELAAFLKVTEPALRAFMRRHDVVLLTRQNRPQRTLPTAMTADELATFTDELNGILPQLMENRRGSATRIGDIIRELAEEKIQDATKLNAALKEIDGLGLLPKDATRARYEYYQGPKLRVHEALSIIARYIGHPGEPTLTREDGTRLFGFPKERLDMTADEFEAFTDKTNGLLTQLLQHAGAASYKMDEVIPALASEKITDAEAREKALIEIAALNISPNDGNSARQGVIPAARRIRQGLQIIAKALGHGDGSLLTQDSGTSIFGFESIKRSATPPPPLSDIERTTFLDKTNGIFTQLTQNQASTSMRMDEVITKLATRLIPDKNLLAAVLVKIEPIGVSAADGRMAKQGNQFAIARIHAALLVISRTLGHADAKLLTAQQGTAIFGFNAIKIPKEPPALSEIDARKFNDENDGILKQLVESRKGVITAIERVLLDLATEKIGDPDKRDKCLADIEALNFSHKDGDKARRGALAPAYRIHEGLRLIAEAMGYSEKTILTREQGTRIFGFK